MTLTTRAKEIIEADPALAAEIARLVIRPVAGLTYRQRQVLDFISEFISENGGISPSYSEISEGSGVAKTVVAGVVDALVERGFIRKLPGCHRSISIISDPFGVPAPADHAGVPGG